MYLISAHAEELSRWYYPYSPPLESLVRLFDKARLVADARAAGLDVPETLDPGNDIEVEQAGQRLGFPLFIKPRSQVFGVDLGKGVRVERASELIRVWRTQRDTAKYSDKILDLIPNLSLPLVCPSSTFIPEKSGEIIGTTGLDFAPRSRPKRARRCRRLAENL